jgi:hypothetical protein
VRANGAQRGLNFIAWMERTQSCKENHDAYGRS